MRKLQYWVAFHEKTNARIASLINRRANGGLAGEDVHLIDKTTCTADVSGINDNTISGLSIVTAAMVVESHLGPIWLIMHQYAYHRKGSTLVYRLGTMVMMSTRST